MKKSVYEKTLKNAGLKSTPARIGVIEILEKSDAPLDATEIHSKLFKKGVRKDPVTIYRILDKLATENLIKRIEFQEGKFRYEISGEDHHHLVCDKCGRICDITICPIESLEKTIYKTEHFLVKRHTLEFFGLCRNCL